MLNSVLSKRNRNALKSYFDSIDKSNILSINDINNLYNEYLDGKADKVDLMLALKYVVYYKVLNIDFPVEAQSDAYTIINNTYVYLLEKVNNKTLNANAESFDDYFDKSFDDMLADKLQNGSNGHKEVDRIVSENKVVASKISFKNKGMRQALTK